MRYILAIGFSLFIYSGNIAAASVALTPMEENTTTAPAAAGSTVTATALTPMEERTTAISVAAVDVSAVEAAPIAVDERLYLARHIRILAQNNILTLEGVMNYLDDPSHAKDLLAVALSFGKRQTLDNLIAPSRDYVMTKKIFLNGVIRVADSWEKDTSDIRYLHTLLNSALIEADDAVYRSEAKGMYSVMPYYKELLLSFHRDINRFIDNALPFASPAYQDDFRVSRPIFDKRNISHTGQFKWQEDGSVLLYDELGFHTTIFQDHLQNIDIISSPCKDSAYLMDITFASGLNLKIGSFTERDIRNFKSMRERKLQSLGTKKMVGGSSTKASLTSTVRKPPTASETVAELEDTPSIKASGHKPSKSKKTKGTQTAAAFTPTDTDPSAVSKLTEAASTLQVRAEPEFPEPSASGAGAVLEWVPEESSPTPAAAKMGPALDADSIAKSLTWAYGRPRKLPSLASLASHSGTARPTSMDEDDKAMLANLLKANGDRRFGEIHTANAYNWTNLKKLLAHLGFVETEDNYEFTYEGHSIKLHYIHWAQHALDDKTLNIMFRQMANIGLTEEKLRGIIGL